MSVVSVLRPQQLSVIQGVQSEKIYGVPVARPMVALGQDYVTLPKLGRFRYQRHWKFYGDPETVEVIREVTEY